MSEASGEQKNKSHGGGTENKKRRYKINSAANNNINNRRYVFYFWAETKAAEIKRSGPKMKSRKIISAEIKEKYRPKRSGGGAVYFCRRKITIK